MTDPNLTVVVVGAKGLRGVDMGKTSDSYCVVTGVQGTTSKVMPLQCCCKRGADVFLSSSSSRWCERRT